MRRLLSQHSMAECPKRTQPCKYCGKEFVFDTIQVGFISSLLSECPIFHQMIVFCMIKASSLKACFLEGRCHCTCHPNIFWHELAATSWMTSIHVDSRNTKNIFFLCQPLNCERTCALITHSAALHILTLCLTPPQNHQYHCPRFPVQCPNQCGTPNIAREDLANHVKDNCGSALILCPFKDAGCKHRVRPSSCNL